MLLILRKCRSLHSRAGDSKDTIYVFFFSIAPSAIFLRRSWGGKKRFAGELFPFPCAAVTSCPVRLRSRRSHNRQERSVRPRSHHMGGPLAVTSPSSPFTTGCSTVTVFTVGAQPYGRFFGSPPGLEQSTSCLFPRVEVLWHKVAVHYLNWFLALFFFMPPPFTLEHDFDAAFKTAVNSTDPTSNIQTSERKKCIEFQDQLGKRTGTLAVTCVFRVVLK